MERIDELVFEKSSGNVRGTVGAFLDVNGKEKRIAHATLLVDELATISLEVPKKLRIDDFPRLTKLLADFAVRVQELSKMA